MHSRIVLAWLAFFSAGVWGYSSLSRTLQSDLRLFCVLLPVVLINVVTISMFSSISATGRAKWAWLLTPCVCFVLIYVGIIKAVGKASPYQKDGIQYTYGFLICLLLLIILVWILSAPVKAWPEASPHIQRLGNVIAGIGATAELFFVSQFISNLLSTSLSMEQFQNAMSKLLLAGVILYVLMGVRILLPRTID